MISLPLCPASLTQKISPKTHKSSWHASRRMQRSIDQLIWRCFCRLPCLCDFCGCCLTMHISFSLCCTLQKNYLLSVWSHKGPRIFSLGLVLFWTGTQWFWTGTHGLFTRWVPRLTITICNKITATIDQSRILNIGIISLNQSFRVLIILWWKHDWGRRIYNHRPFI